MACQMSRFRSDSRQGCAKFFQRLDRDRAPCPRQTISASKERMMVSRLQQIGLVLIGLVLGVLVSVQLSASGRQGSRAVADRGLARLHRGVWPDQERLRRTGRGQEAHLRGHQRHGIRASILTPPIWTSRRSRNCRSARRANSAASASKSAWKTASSRSWPRSRTRRPGGPA